MASKKKAESYFGKVKVETTIIHYIFRTFKLWAEFVCSPECCATEHCADRMKNVIVMPVAALRQGSSFGEESEGWSQLRLRGFTPLSLSRAVPVTMNHAAVQAVVDDLRDVLIYVVDETSLVFSGTIKVFCSVFVKSGYVTTSDPPETRMLMNVPVTGHFGWIPQDLLDWKSQSSSIISATFTSSTHNGAPMMNKNHTKIKFRPIVLASSGMIL